MTATTTSRSYFQVYGVPLTVLAVLFVVSWYTEFFSLTAFGILDDHRKTTTSKLYSISRGNSTSINNETTTTTSNTSHTVTPSTTIETPLHVSIHKSSQSQQLSDDDDNKNNNLASSLTDDSSQRTSAASILPWPLQVLHEYQRQHSIQALIQDEAAATTTTHTNTNNDNNEHRKFAVVYYYCPHRAGNILHNLFISMTWAMIHNRTILWKYDTDFTTHRNTVQDCQAVLKRAEWLASWDEWAPRLGLISDHQDTDDDVIVPIPIDRSRLQYDSQHRVVVYPQIKDVMKLHSNLFRTEWRNDPSHSRNNLLYLRDLDEAAKVRAAKLYNEGVDFLFGMLFREVFTVKNAVENPFDKFRFSHSHDNVFSLALHSRHTVIGDDGSFIPDEIKCLEQLLPNHNESRTLDTCVVYLMSDRPRTIQKLLTWLEQHNCTGVTASLPSWNKTTTNYNDSGVSTVLHDEMGPNQGEGFIRELELASAARSGLIGDFRRSSFMLLVELVEYGRRMDNWRNSGETMSFDDGNENDNLLRCDLPERYGAGYDYGPGTPTFRAAHHQKPLAPIQVFNKYKSMHSAEILRQETWLDGQEHNTSRHFVVGYLPCPIDSSIDGIRSFLNDILLAFASNRTLLWKYANVGFKGNNNNILSSCDRFIQPNDWLPSYDEFCERLGLSGADKLHVLSEENSMILDVTLVKSEQVGLFPDHQRGQTLNLSSLVSFTMPASSDFVNSSQAEMLYSEGINFLYGMLLEEAFQYREIVQQPALSHSNAILVSDASFTLGLHIDDPVKDIDQASSCLRTVISNMTTDRCNIYLATFGQQVLTLDQRLGGKCTIHTLTKRGVPEEMTLDDSSTANLHFFQDFLYCAKHVRSGFVGKAGSSASALFVERIEYLRRIEIWKQGRIPRILPEFRMCQA